MIWVHAVAKTRGIHMKNGNEGIDCKKYLLLFLGKLWLVVLAAVAGAVLGGGIYWFYHVVISNNREYKAESKIYLDFAPDETGEVYQAYNGYTWNDLMATEPILNTTMSYLPDGYTQEEVTGATTAEILSDLRLLTITVITDAPEKTNAILQATDLSLVDLGERVKEFRDISIYKETEAELVVADQRMFQAVLLGAVLALLAALLVMALVYAMDDKIYVPGDLAIATDLPFVGFHFTDAAAGLAGKTTGRKMEEVTGGMDTEAIGMVDRKTSDRSAAKVGRKQKLYETLQEDCEQNRAYLEEENGSMVTFCIKKGQQIETDDMKKLREAQGVLLAVTYGAMDRTTLRYRIEQLKLQDCRLKGILIQDADMRFMIWYYNHL